MVKFIDENADEEKSGNYVTTDKVLTASVKPMIFGDGSYRKITKVNYSVNGSELKSLPFEDFNGEYYPVKIKVADLGNISGDVTVQLTAVDDASSDGQGTIYFIVDNEPPTDLAITSPLLKDKDYITTLTSEINDINENEISFYQNKEMILKGTISDNYKISKTILEISKVDSDSECTLELVVGKDGKLTLSSEEDKSDAITELSGIPGNFTIKLDTEKLSDGDYILKTTSYDAAGNSTSWGDEENAENEEYYFKVLQDADKPRITFNVDFNDKMEVGVFPGTILKGSFVDDDAMKENGVKYLLIETELDDSAVKEKFEKSSVTILDNVKEFTRQDWQLDKFQSVGTQYLYMQAEDINGEKSDIYKRKITVTSTESPFVKSVSSAPVTAGGESNGYYSGMVKIIVNASGGSCGVKDLMYRITSSSVESSDGIVEHAASEGNFALGTPTSGDLGKWHKYTFIDIDESNRENVEFLFDSRLFADNKNETINVEVKCVNTQVTESITVKDKIAIDNEGPTLKIASPILGTSVNKIFDINGSCNDKGSGVQNVYVGYFKSDVTSITHTDIKNNLSDKAELNKWNKLAVDGISWDGRFDSEIIHNGNDKKDYKLVLAAVDNLNNVSIIEHEIKIDQNTDRPIIRLQNLDLSSNGTIWHKSAFIYGTVSDDDSGNVDVRISEDGGKNWSENCFANGSWSYTFKDDGEKVLAFKVTDGAGTTFTSADNDGLTVPKIVDSQGNQKSESKFNLKVDTQDPKMIDVYFNVKPTNKDEDYQPQTPAAVNNIDSSVWTSSFSGKVFGGTENAIWFMFGGNDANGIASGDLTCITENSGAVIGELIAENKNETAFYKCKIDISKVELTLLTFKVEIKDKSGLVSQKSFTVDIDNMAPTINFNSHSNGSKVYGTDPNIIKGTVSDGESLVEYALTKDNNAPTSGYSTLENPLNWEISFEGTNILNEKIRSIYGITGSSFEDLYDLYFWIKATDKYGNISEPKSLKLVVLPNGDKPQVNIDYPEYPDKNGELKILGGKITISGTTDILTNSVKEVYVQIDPSYDGTFSESWATDENSVVKNYYAIETDPVVTGVKGIKVTSSSKTNWRLNINENKELSNADSANTVAVKAIAVSNSGKYTESDVVVFKIDENVPQFADLKLVKYDTDNTTVLKTLEYKDDMWLSGDGWKLECNIKDDNGIDEASIMTDKFEYSTIETKVLPGNKGFNVKIPLGTKDFGNINFMLTAKDCSDKKNENSQSFVMNYDNTAPEFIVKELSGNNTNRTRIENSDGVYTINGTFNEDSLNGYNQSGFERIAMYFTRTVNGKTYIIDPMLQKGDDGDDNRYTISDFEQHGGMYWREAEISDITGSTVTLNGSLPENVRPGGLCEIGGAIYRINEVSSGEIVLEETPSAADKAYFAVAQVIDNMIIENGKTTYYGDSNNISYDDRDKMVEGVARVGTTYNWTVSINSENIFDGNTDVHFVAFDKAGNATPANCYASVTNNAPRIAGASFATDTNVSETVEEDEFITTYANSYVAGDNVEGQEKGVSVNGKKGTEKVIKLNLPLEGSASLMTIKGDTIVKAKIVGGNGGLQWQWRIGDKAWSDLKNLADGSSYGNEIRSELSMEIKTEDFLSKTIGNIDNTTLSIKVVDETENGSQSAEINIQVKTVLQDTTAPTVKITPFYWNSETDNSLYQNSRTNGHIELEKDLTAVIKSWQKGEPKVSGKITIEGTATDNVRVDELRAVIEGFNGDAEFTIATRSADGKNWTSAGNMTNNGWACEILDDTFTKDGNTLKWKFHWDTSKVTGVAKQDVLFKVKAKDKGQASLNGGRVVYKTPNVSDYDTYLMDVVPYITGIYRAKTVNTNRAKSGAVPILRNETSNYIEGFNLGATIKASITTEPNGGGSSDSLNPTYSNGVATYTVPDTVKDGYLNVTVNGVNSLNNINDDSKEYNKEVNPYLEETTYWTDDRSVRVWENESTDYFPGSGSPVYPAMSMGSGGTLYASFSNYSTASVYYSQMGGSATRVFYTYDPAEETDIHVTETNTVNVAYSANYHGGYEDNWTKNAGDAGGLYVYDVKATEKNPGRDIYYKFNKFELFYHDRMLQQFKNIRVKRSNIADDGLVHVAYYDKVTSSIHYSNSPGNGNQRAEDNEYAWVNIDGGYDEDDTGSYFKNLTSSGGWRPTYTVENQNSVRLADSNFEGTKRSNGTGESVGLALTKSRYPVVVYYDTDNMILKVARATQENPKGNTSYWKVQDVLATGDINYKSMVDYISCDIDANGNLHIVFQNGKNQLCYVKSTNASANGSTAYTFGQSVVIASGATWIDLTLKGTTPYVSYLSQINSKDGMNIAFYDSTFDTDFDGVADGEWETMVAPLNYKVTNVRSCIEAHPTPASSTWEAAVGFTPGDYYRVAYYVGSGKGH